jgi:uncharacterized cupin superfamily protein
MKEIIMPKRVVTGQRADGTSRFARVEEMDQDVRGIGSYRGWAIDDLPGLRLPFLGLEAPLTPSPPAGATPEALRTAAPQPRGPGQFRVSLHRMAPGADGEEWTPYMHWHDTFDLQWLIAGELTIRLDDGSEVRMQPGDVVVQHGTNHAWRSGSDGALMAIFMYGAQRVGIAPPARDALDEARWDAARDNAPPPDPTGVHANTPVPEFLARLPRRIVTGQRADGTSVFARVEEVGEDARTTAGGPNPGLTVHRLCGGPLGVSPDGRGNSGGSPDE